MCRIGTYSALIPDPSMSRTSRLLPPKSLDGESVDRWGRPCGLSHLASQTCRQAANSEGRIR
jgi:hypothetical protein